VSAANRDLVYWYGDMEFVTHFWNLLALSGVEVLVTIQPRIECFRYEDNSNGRKKLAEDCYDRVLGREVEKETIDEEDEENTGEQPSKLSPS
jgi:hypothetical protein